MIGERIRTLRERNGLTQGQLADKVEIITQKSISMYETGSRMPTSEVLERLASVFGVSIDYLLGRDTRVQGMMIPVVGEVRAGLPLYADHNITAYEEISPDLEGEYFALKVKGDSMAQRIEHGDIIIVKKQSEYKSGDICVVLVNGEEATIKTIQHKDNGIMLLPKNSNYMPQFYTWEEVKSLPVDIIGKAIEVRGKL